MIKKLEIASHNDNGYNVIRMAKPKFYKDADGTCHKIKRRLSFKKWRELRFKVWIRDGYKCVHCGQYVTFSKAHIDHIQPISKGGGNALANLRTLCVRCHSLRKDDSHEKLRRRSFEKGIIPKNFWRELWD